MKTTKSSQNVIKDLESFIEADRIYSNEIRRTAFSVDASMFERVAKTRVDIENEQEVVKLLDHARTTGTPVTCSRRWNKPQWTIQRFPSIAPNSRSILEQNKGDGRG